MRKKLYVSGQVGSDKTTLVNSVQTFGKKIITTTTGGLEQEALRAHLKTQHILLNDYAEMLLESQFFTVSPKARTTSFQILTIAELGLATGGTLPEVYHAASTQQLALCSYEEAVYLRLALTEQADSSLKDGRYSTNEAPAEAFTVASPVVTPDDNFPKGFYLRQIDGEVWLRGYCCDDLHRFKASDQFVFRLDV